MAVQFTIFGQERTISVSGRDLDLLKQSSRPLRELIETAETQPIVLFPRTDQGVDATSIQYLLEHIGLERDHSPEEQLQQLGTLNITTLSGQCNALHYYRCDPNPFTGLWDRLFPPWVIIPRPAGKWVWRATRRREVPSSEWPHYANAAWVLRKDEEFSDSLSSTVWATPLDHLDTAVKGLRNLKKHRLKCMKNLFCRMVDCIVAIDKKDPAIGREIRRRIDSSQHLDVHLAGSMQGSSFISPWKKSRAHLRTRSIYAFALQVDFVLLENTSLDYDIHQRHPNPHRENDSASTHGRVGPRSVIRPRLGAIRAALSGSNNLYAKEVKSMLDIMDQQIIQDQARLRAKLIGERGASPTGDTSLAGTESESSTREDSEGRGSLDSNPPSTPAPRIGRPSQSNRTLAMGRGQPNGGLPAMSGALGAQIGHEPPLLAAPRPVSAMGTGTHGSIFSATTISSGFSFGTAP